MRFHELVSPFYGTTITNTLPDYHHMDTLQYLQNNSIPCYFSGCLTLTLQKNEELKYRAKENPYILCVDVPEEVSLIVKQRSNKPVYNISKLYSPYINSIDRMTLAKCILYMYHNASAVITTNLHTAMPCLAFETPVCLLDLKTYNHDRKGRFSGIENLLYSYSVDEFLENDVYDICNPPSNSDDYCLIRQKIEERCRLFTGYDSYSPAISTDFNVTVELLNIMKENIDNTNRVLYYAGKRTLLKTAIRRIIYNLDRNDVII